MMTDAAERIVFCCFVKRATVCLNSLTIRSFSSILLKIMPITRSAIKKLKQDVKREALNKAVKKKVKEAVKKLKLAPSDKLLAHVFRALDIAKKKKIYHSNKVARLKSHLSRLVRKNTPSKSAHASSAKVKKSPKKA